MPNDPLALFRKAPILDRHDRQDTFGGFVHILLVLAVVVLVFQLVSGRRAI